MNRNSRIGIIGAGCSGLFTAWYLKKAGFDHVCVLEREERVGGQCQTFNYKGKTYELGSMMALSTYKHIQKIMKELGITNQGPYLYRGFFQRDGSYEDRIRPENAEEFLQQFARLPGILKEYKTFEKEGFLNLDPSLSIPFSEWCKVNGIPLLEEIYKPHFTGFGYGFTDEIPAAYVLKFLDYKSICNFIQVIHLITWVEGSQGFLEKLAENMDIRLSSPVEEVIPQGSHVVVKTNREEFKFDRVIFAVNPSEILNFYNPNEELKCLLGKIQYNWFNALAYSVQGIPKVSGYIRDNCCKERNGHLMTWYYRWQEQNDNDLIVAYSCNYERKNPQEVQKMVDEDLDHLGVTEHRLYMMKQWKHFPHVSPEEMRNGFFDKVWKTQGENGIYFTGEWLSFASMEACAVFSEYLIDSFFLK